jgi:hypothetical protein
MRRRERNGAVVLRDRLKASYCVFGPWPESTDPGGIVVGATAHATQTEGGFPNLFVDSLERIEECLALV